MNRSQFIRQFNSYYSSGVPFFFLIDYAQSKFDVVGQSDLDKAGIFFTMPEEMYSPIYSPPKLSPQEIIFAKSPPSYADYEPQFQRVMEEIKKGNTYLLNLTMETPIQTSLSLKEIYDYSQASYRLYYKDQFISFSPETFIQTSRRDTEKFIHALPMKGTYLRREDAELAAQQKNEKELWEQTTVVDRVRNDLSMISDQVKVDHFLAIQEVATHRAKIYQTTSRVTGRLGEDYRRDPAGAILKLLPAASVTGAPRDKTMEIIREVETHDRHFYTGVWGRVAEGEIDSAVIIRYIEKRGDDLYYKSGGGITFLSNPEQEYREMIDKVYLPFSYSKKYVC